MRQFVTAFVILAVVGIGGGLLVVYMLEVRDRSNRAHCRNNLKQLANATFNYSTSYDDRLPPAAMANERLPVEKRLAWSVALLPFLEQNAIYKMLDLSQSWDSPANSSPLASCYLARQWLRCPKHPTPFEEEPWPVIHYVGLTGIEGDANARGVFSIDQETRLNDIRDGTSNTLLLIETCRKNGPWAAAGYSTARALDRNDTPYLGPRAQFGSGHPRGITGAALVDGSVHELSLNIDPAVLEALITVAGGEETNLR
jgi:hypothetical protein